MKQIAILVVLLVIVGCNEAAQVVREEFGPRESLRKYEWFKDAAAQCEKKLSDIRVYQGRVDRMHKEYEGTPFSKWDRGDKERLAIMEGEVAGIKASYNSLAAEYNAQMSKISWRYAEVGKLPQGATEPLPREFKAYLEE